MKKMVIGLIILAVVGLCILGCSLLMNHDISHSDRLVQWGYSYDGEPVVYTVRESAVPLLDRSFGFNAIGKQCLSSRQYELALKDFEIALDYRTKAVGADHPFTSSVLANIGLTYQAMGKLDLAEAIFKKAADIQIKSAEPTNHDYKLIITDLLDLYKAEHKMHEYEALKKQSGL